MALAAKLIASNTTRAGLAEILGSTGEQNVQGEEVQKLDHYADRTIFRMNDHTGRLAVMASEEEEEIIPIPAHFPIGNYVLVYDPLDGSSNIDYNVSIGTIFAIYRRVTAERAGYAGRLSPERGEHCGCRLHHLWLQHHDGLLDRRGRPRLHPRSAHRRVSALPPLHSHPGQSPSITASTRAMSISGAKACRSSPTGCRAKQGTDEISLRYIGSLVADFHRNLLTGGIFYYPADTKDPSKPNGKLRLLYECGPLAFLAEQAGGYASDGTQSIMDIKPTSLHQRVPLFIGNRDLVEKAEEFIAQYG